MGQLRLFESAPAMPGGFTYQPEVFSRLFEQQLVAFIAELPFKAFEFHGHTGNRRVVSYGWKYDYDAEMAYRVAEIPEFLHALRGYAARVAGMKPERLQQALVTEYQPGVSIGWHRDKAIYGQVVGVSLLSACTFRLRLKTGASWLRKSLVVEPRSIYVLDGPARTEWEHSIASVDKLRYSITFRNLRDEAMGSAGQLRDLRSS